VPYLEKVTTALNNTPVYGNVKPGSITSRKDDVRLQQAREAALNSSGDEQVNWRDMLTNQKNYEKNLGKLQRYFLGVRALKSPQHILRLLFFQRRLCLHKIEKRGFFKNF
jgi:glutamate synthase domain-containing protein 1